MADYDLKTTTPEATFTDGTSVLFGADGQSAGTPAPYTSASIKAWINSWHADKQSWNPYYADSTIYNTNPGFAGPVSGGLTNNRIYMVPVYLQAGRNYTTLAIVITTAGAASTVAQLALYASDPTTNRPTGTALATGAATIALDSTGVKTATISYTPTISGWYFMALCGNGAPVCATFSTSTTGSVMGVQFTATPAAVSLYGIYRALTYTGSQFTDESATTFVLATGGTIPIIGIR